MILFVNGYPDDNLVRLAPDKDGNTQVLRRGSTDALPHLGIKEDQHAILTLYGAKLTQPKLTLPSRPRLIFSQIADPDTCYGALERCAHLVQNAGCPVINDPASVMRTTRHQVAESLQGIDDLRVPRTIQCEPLSPEDIYHMASAAGIESPFIVRVAGEHGGKKMLRIDGDEDLPRLHVFPFDGRSYYVSEYLDFADIDGAYHKYRISVVGGRAIARHALVSPDWNVHGTSRTSTYSQKFTPEHERVAWLENEILPGLSGMISTISDRLNLDYFGIDCSITKTGEVTLFEANSAMNMFQNSVLELNPVIDRIRLEVRDLISRYSGMSLN